MVLIDVTNNRRGGWKKEQMGTFSAHNYDVVNKLIKILKLVENKFWFCYTTLLSAWIITRRNWDCSFMSKYLTQFVLLKSAKRFTWLECLKKSVPITHLGRTEWAKEEGEWHCVRNGIAYFWVSDSWEANGFDCLWISALTVKEQNGMLVKFAKSHWRTLFI